MTDHRKPGQHVRVTLKRLAQVEVVGVEAISDASGRDFMPHPFGHTQSSRFNGWDGYERYTRELLDRVNHGDLSELKHWFSDYVTADLRVECVIDTNGEPSRRLMAHRCGDAGYLAIQQPDEDMVDVYSLAPNQLGAAIAGSANLIVPGKRAMITIPDIDGTSPPRRENTGQVSIHVQSANATGAVALSSTEITSFARVQSRWQPARDWGFDRQKKAVVWVRIDGDGEYVYSSGYKYLTPVTTRDLAQRIDQLISEDVAAIREARGAR